MIEKSAAHLNGHALQILLDDMEHYLSQLRRVSTGKQTAALEASIRDARSRLHGHQAQQPQNGQHGQYTQRHHNLILNAPTEPGRHNMGRR